MTEQQRIHQYKESIGVEVYLEFITAEKGAWLFDQVLLFERGKLTLRELEDSFNVPF